MKKSFKGFISFVLIAATVFTLCCPAFAAGETADETTAGFTADDFLTTKGQDIVNRKGDGMCPMEETVKDIDNAEKALSALKQK